LAQFAVHKQWMKKSDDCRSAKNSSILPGIMAVLTTEI